MRIVLLALIFCLPLIAPRPAMAAPPIQNVEWRDLSAWLVSDDTLPLITVKMGWRGGSAGEPADKAGLVMLMARLMNEGAGDLSARQFQQAMADKAISIGFNANHDEVSATLRCLKTYQNTCFELLRLAVTRPRFDGEAIERMKGEQRAALLRSAQSAGSIAADNFRQLAFGDHPYGRAVNGTLDSLTAIDKSQLPSTLCLSSNQYNPVIQPNGGYFILEKDTIESWVTMDWGSGTHKVKYHYVEGYCVSF